ncbi:unnamed protein product [Rotaria sp. Silwood2]|nr:unnamed protein product [Rotaria sp. Silwood2]
MIKHQKSCQTSNKNNRSEYSTIKQYFRPKTSSSIPRTMKEKITNAAVELVSLDNRAFELISGDGFINFAQTVLDVGQTLSNRQNLNILDLLPHPTTVSVSFCGIGLFHLNDDLQLYVFILGCYPYDRDNQSSNQIRQFIDSKLMEYHLTLDDSKFVVCDNENKMKSSFKDLCTRVGCSIHYLNKQLQHCFTTDVIDKMPVDCDIVQQMFNSIRQIVSHMRRSHKQSKLSRKLQSYSDSRFNSAFYTMNVFLIVFDELAGILERTYMNDYMLIDKDLFASVCLFLKPFEEVIEQFSCDTKPTIYKVLALRQYLLNHCKIDPDDHDGIQQIKIFLAKRIQDIWIFQNIHYITTFLHSSMKNFHVNLDLQEKAIELVQQEMLKRQPTAPSNTFTPTATTSACTNALDSKSTASKDLLSSCFDIPKIDLKSTSPSYDELKEYMTLDVQLTEQDDILQFWLQQKSKFPILFSVVQDFYAVPASNTSIERLFSSSKNTVTDKRSSLGADKINKLLFLQKNLTLLKSFDKKTSIEANTNEMKRKMVEKSSPTIFNANQEQSITTTTKKFKMNEVNVTLSDDNYEEENDEVDLF